MEVVMCISVLIIIALVLVICELKDELCEAKTALKESEKHLDNIEHTAFCALRNVEKAKKELSVIESGVDVKSNVKGFRACAVYRSLDGCLTRAIVLLTSVAYYKTHF